MRETAGEAAPAAGREACGKKREEKSMRLALRESKRIMQKDLVASIDAITEEELQTLRKVIVTWHQRS